MTGRSRRRLRTRIHVPASYAGLKEIFDTCERFAARSAVPDAVRHDIYVAIEELVSNVMRHGSRPGSRPRVTMALTVAAGSCRVVLADNGAAFNPLAAAPPDVDGELLDRPVGGLGIALVRGLMEDLRYRRLAGCNHVMMRKSLLQPVG